MKNVKTGHKKPIVCLDAGHYGEYNRSPAVKTYYESNMNWKLHNLLKKYLEQYGIEVKQTRSNQKTDLGLFSRGQKAKGSDLFLSIHSNAVGSGVNESVDYPVVYVPLNGSGNEIGKMLAECIEKTMGTKQKGRTETRKGNNGDYYGVIRGAVSVGVPGLILEHSFHTNTKMTKWLLKDANLDKLAEAEAKIIAEWFDVENIQEPERWYRIRKEWDLPETQLGAYKDFELAKKNCPDDYAVFDWNGKAVYERFGRYESEEYPLVEFIKDIQKACGAAVDGIAGPETLSKTVTLSAKKNARHAAVKAVQTRLFYLGYQEVGEADGIAGPKFTSAVAHFQQDNGCVVDGEITAGNKTWKKLLGV